MGPHSTPTGPLSQPLFSATLGTRKLALVTVATTAKYKGSDLHQTGASVNISVIRC